MVHQQSRYLSILPTLALLLLTASFSGCGGNDECSPEAIALGKLGTDGQCGCLNDNNCPTNQSCEPNPFDFVSECSCNPGQNGAECAVNEDCAAGQTCSFNCICEGEPTGSCPAVNVEPGTVPFGGACDADADCADGMPCVDCSCV